MVPSGDAPLPVASGSWATVLLLPVDVPLRLLLAVLVDVDVEF